MKLFVTIPFHRTEEKTGYLSEVLESLQQIQAEKTIIIHTDDPGFNVAEKNVTVEYVKLDNPWNLTWVHKDYFQSFILSDYTHFIYLEDDIKLTPTAFDYWLNTRRLLKRTNTNFVPGFLIVEYKDRVAYSVAFHGDYKLKLTVVGNKLFFCPENSYQCMFIMDKDLAWEHMHNESFKKGVQADGLGQPEAANSAYLHFNVPEGFPNRILMPYEGFVRCAVHHLPNKYVNMPTDIHGKVPMFDIAEKVKGELLNVC
jgi:hypothetical protein